MRKSIFLYVIFFSFILLYGCYGKMSEPPEIQVTSDGREISYVVGLNKWNGSVYDREDTFQTIMKEKADIPYIKLKKEIQIEFKGTLPDSIKLQNFILNCDGKIKYTEKEVQTIPIEFSNKKGTFVLTQNIASMLSSNSADYEPGASIRGFRLYCSWGENDCEYAFIISSDAK